MVNKDENTLRHVMLYVGNCGVKVRTAKRILLFRRAATRGAPTYGRKFSRQNDEDEIIAINRAVVHIFTAVFHLVASCAADSVVAHRPFT